MVEVNQEIKRHIMSWELPPKTRFQIEKQGAGEAAWYNVRVPEGNTVQIGWGEIKRVAKQKIGQGTITEIFVAGQPTNYCVDRGIEIRRGAHARVFFGQDQGKIIVAPRQKAA